MAKKSNLFDLNKHKNLSGKNSTQGKDNVYPFNLDRRSKIDKRRSKKGTRRAGADRRQPDETAKLDDIWPNAGGTSYSARNLKLVELQCIRWAVAGKTLKDIAQILDMPVRTVRYHIDNARLLYGFATNQQLYVAVAKEFDLDPLGPDL